MHVQAGVISGNYFEVMGLSAVVGRLTNSQDDGPGAPPVAVLVAPILDGSIRRRSAASSARRFASTISSSTIVGVVQRGAALSAAHGHLRQHGDEPAPPERDDGDGSHASHDGSLRPAGGQRDRRAGARRRSTRISRQRLRRSPGRVREGVALRDHRHPASRERSTRRASLTLWLLMGAATFVLLIACANVANLTLMRGVGREREMLVRAALGAGSWRLQTLLLVENLTLALLGGALGVLVAFAGLKMLVAFAAQLTPRADEIRVDGLVLAVSLVTSVAAAIVLSFVPQHWVGELARRAARGRRTADDGGPRTPSASATLVVAQLAVCMVLLTAAGLLVRTLGKLQSVETGVRADHVLTLDVPIESRVDPAAGEAADVRAHARCSRALPGSKSRRLARTCRSSTRSSRSR